MEFANFDELEKAWDSWFADPGTPAWMEKYFELTESSHNEVWDLHEE
jgi:hypothetical protein